MADEPARAQRRRRSAVAAAVVATVLLPATASPPASAQQSAAPEPLTWAQLVPPPKPNAKPPGLKSFLSGRPKEGINFDHSSGSPDGRWLSPGALPQPGAGTPPDVVEALDGRRIKIGGYLVPLDFDAAKVREFLLVPFVGACIHVPPPPANQLVYVKFEPGFEIKATFDPIWVTGTMRTKIAFTGLAEAGYSLDADKVETRAE